MACVNGCTTVDYGACVMKVCQGIFEKAGMACSCAVDGCDKDCAVMESADAVIDPEWEWHMLDNPPGR